jgi:hypothetical protein
VPWSLLYVGERLPRHADRLEKNAGGTAKFIELIMLMEYRSLIIKLWAI